MSWTEVFFGLGYMLGPAIGSALYSLGGFMLPFIAVGSFGVIVSVLMIFAIPNIKSDEPSKKKEGKMLTYRALIRASYRNFNFKENATSKTFFSQFPSIYLPFLDNSVALFAQSFMVSMVEPHLRAAGATQYDIGMAFLIFGAVFGVGTFSAGFVSALHSVSSLPSYLISLIAL
jgi:predicted MFS family arabinose efflux permease